MAKAFVKESLPNDKRDKSVKASLQRMKTDIFNLKFMLVVLSLSFIMAGFFSYLAASPFVFQRIYEFSAFEFSLPTVTDRFVQQAVALVLSEEYEKVSLTIALALDLTEVVIKRSQERLNT